MLSDVPGAHNRPRGSRGIGADRAGSFRRHVEALAEAAGLWVLVIDVDIEQDGGWDLCDPLVINALLDWIEQGLVDLLLGPPPLLYVEPSALSQGRTAAVTATRRPRLGLAELDQGGERARDRGKPATLQLPVPRRGSQ